MHGCYLPMPLKEELDLIERETRDLDMEGDPGPHAKKWLERVDDWVYHLELWFRGTDPTVAGSWRDKIDEWEKLLRVLPKSRRERVLNMIRHGVGLPWDGPPPDNLRDPRTGGCPPNNPRLGEQRQKVWATLYEQLIEGAIGAWDCQGRSDVDVLPKGMYPINWQIKPGSNKVRITVNMRALKKRLCEQYSKGVDLPSVDGSRMQHEKDDWSVAFDLHSSYYHPEYLKSCYTWLGFSLRDDELTEEAIEYLWEFYPQCRFRDRWVFYYKSYAMGNPPSVADFQEIMQAVTDACLMSGVGKESGLPVEAWRAFLFIDDIKGSTKGGPRCGLRFNSGFASAVELGLNLLATLMSLGCFVNFEKSDILPRQKDNVCLGMGHNSVVMRFFLPKKRIGKLIDGLRDLRSRVRIGEKVLAKSVARIIGLLYSIQVCCHKAVALMCRGMIRILAVMLGVPHLVIAFGSPNFKWLLKKVWRGYAIWTWEAEMDLRFWEWVPWSRLWAPFGYDVLVEAMKDYVRQGRVGELANECSTVASDASTFAVGGGSFKPVGGGEFECTRFSHHMLRISSKKRSSALRELEGIISTLVALDLPSGSRVVIVIDNEAVYRIWVKGSGGEELQFLARYGFLYCLRRGIFTFPVWQRRSSSIIKFCDEGSRIVDRCAYSAHPGLFWGANDIAIKLWGRGFTYDRFGSGSQVQPSDGQWKLPFSSRFRGAFASGCDAFTQDWSSHVNWVNPPFALGGKVLALMREQNAVGAMVIPQGWKGVKHWWLRELLPRCEGVVHRWNLRSTDDRCIPVNKEVDTQPRRYGLAIVFLDFRRRSSPEVQLKGVPAEVIQRAWVGSGCPLGIKYWRVDGNYIEGLPALTPCL